MQSVLYFIETGTTMMIRLSDFPRQRHDQLYILGKIKFIINTALHV